MSDFRNICVASQLHPSGVVDAARSVGATLLGEGMIGGAKHTMWKHEVRGHTISITLDDLGRENLGSPAAICTVMDFSDNGETLPFLHRWIRADFPKNPFGFEGYDLDLLSGNPTLVRPEPSRTGKVLDKRGRPNRIVVLSAQGQTSIMLGGGYLKLGAR
jgi:hypothetical protein